MKQFIEYLARVPRTILTLYLLGRAGILSRDNVSLIATNASTYDLAIVLLHLHEAGIFTQDNFNVVATNASTYDLAIALHLLLEAGICSQDNFNAVATNASPFYLVIALHLLHLAGICTQDNFDVVTNHTDPGNLALSLYNLTRGSFNYTVKGSSIILETINAYLINKEHMATSIQNMFIPREYYDVREQYLNQLVAYLLQDTLKPLPINIIAHILEFVQDDTSYRLEAMDIIQHVQLPQNLDLDVYKNDLNQKLQEFNSFQDRLNRGLDKLNLREQGLLLSLEKSSFWANRHSSPDAQHAFDKRYGLVVA